MSGFFCRSGNPFLIAPFPDLCLLVPFDENDDEIQRLLEEKYRLHKGHQDDTTCSSVSKTAAYSNICKIIQTKLRDKQDSSLRKKTEEFQSFADRKDMNKFHDALKTIYVPKNSGATTLLSADGITLLIDKEAILERWAVEFTTNQINEVNGTKARLSSYNPAIQADRKS